MTPPKISHLVVNTSNYEAMKRWYLNVLEAEIGVETSDHSACFLRTDENNHRVGMFNVAKTDDSVSIAPPGFNGAAVSAPRIPDSRIGAAHCRGEAVLVISVIPLSVIVDGVRG